MTTTNKFTATKVIVITDGTVTEIRNRDAYVSRRGVVHTEFCPALARKAVNEATGGRLTVEAAQKRISDGHATLCSACERIAARDAAGYAAVEAAYLAEPVAETETETVKPGSMAERLMAILVANPSRWYRPREIERMWGLKGDAHIRNTFRKMEGVQSKLDDKGALVFALAA